MTEQKNNKVSVQGILIAALIIGALGWLIFKPVKSPTTIPAETSTKDGMPSEPVARARVFTPIEPGDADSGTWSTYTGVMAWAAAVKAVGDAYDFKAVNKHLKEVGYQGLLGHVKWDDRNVIRLQSSVPANHYQVQQGELVTIYTDPPLKPYRDYSFKVPRWIKH